MGGEMFIAEDWKLFANLNYYAAVRYSNLYGNIGVRYILGRNGESKREKAEREAIKKAEEDIKAAQADAARLRAELKKQEEQKRLEEAAKAAEVEIVVEEADEEIVREAKKRRERPMIKAFSMNAASFGSESAQLTARAKRDIRDIAAVIKKHEFTRITIEGHTDNTGTREINKNLSLERARAVYDEFVEAGINPDKMQYVGFGPAMPKATNATEEGRAQNRRTEVFVE
ncbi:MAG: OmpA family protein, partial [Endomicrobia bacterium]|nr:OmpA family protein [Endomicrobiia bacterium]